MNPPAQPTDTASRRFVDNLRALQPTPAQLELYQRLVRLEQLLRKTYQAFVDLSAQNERMALELALLRERVAAIEAAGRDGGTH